MVNKELRLRAPEMPYFLVLLGRNQQRERASIGLGCLHRSKVCTCDLDD